MKQKGKTWINHKGEQTLAKYVPATERISEKIGQLIAAEANEIEKRLQSAKQTLIAGCKEVFRHLPGAVSQNSLTFYTFDREYKIVYDVKQEYVRVYRATKSNPSNRDYEFVNMDFTRVSVLLFGSNDKKVDGQNLVDGDLIPLSDEKENVEDNVPRGLYDVTVGEWKDGDKQSSN